jgi:hypothetical protein
MKAIVLEPGSTEHKAIEVENDFRSLQHVVGGYLEPVNTHRLNMKMNTMLVDEDGHSKGKARNVEAERVSGYAGTIVGTAVIVGTVLGDEGIEWGDFHE